MVRYGRKSFDDNTTSYGIDSEAVERKFRTKISGNEGEVVFLIEGLHFIDYTG